MKEIFAGRPDLPPSEPDLPVPGDPVEPDTYPDPMPDPQPVPPQDPQLPPPGRINPPVRGHRGCGQRGFAADALRCSARVSSSFRARSRILSGTGSAFASSSRRPAAAAIPASPFAAGPESCGMASSVWPGGDCVTAR